MSATAAPFRPRWCPNEACPFHTGPTTSWRWVRAGFFSRAASPHRIQRFQCRHCRRHFSEQTFRSTYWLRQPQLLLPVAHRLLGCSAFRQIAREFAVSPQTILALAARLARHCILFHEEHRPRGELAEPLGLDGFRSFEWSQYHPTEFHLAVGGLSHFCHGFTESELRRSGSMRARQRRQRARLEARRGRPDPRSIEREVTELLAIVTAGSSQLELDTDEHQDYPRALRALERRRPLRIAHRTTSSRAARTAHNRLWALNLLDLLIRHCGANHKRETIAFSKRRQSAAERLWLLLVWRNYVKSFSERKRDATPAMRAGVCRHRFSLARILAERRFPGRIPLPARWAVHYWRHTPTRALPRVRTHRLKYAT
jgi:transposase-like protein